MATVQSRLTDTLNLRRAWLATAPEFPTDVLPVVFGQLTGGSGGISYCPCVDTTAHTYLISDSAILSAAAGNAPTFYADRIVTAPASWTAADTLAGRTVSTVTFAASQIGQRVGYRGAGTASGGALIANPISVAEYVLVTLAGLAISDLHPTALATAKARAAALPYLCAGVLDGDRSPGTTLEEILGCFAAYHYIDPDGQVVLLLDDGRTPGIEGLAAHLRAQDMPDGRAVWTRAEIVNQVAVKFAKNCYDNWLQETYQSYDSGIVTANALSQGLHGALGPGVTAAPLEFPWCRDQATVRAVAAVMVARLATARPQIRFSTPNWRPVHLDPGDYVGFSWPRLYDPQCRPLKNQIGVVEAVGIAGDGQAVALSLRDTGGYLSTSWPLDGAWILDGSHQLGAERDLRDHA